MIPGLKGHAFSCKHDLLEPVLMEGAYIEKDKAQKETRHKQNANHLSRYFHYVQLLYLL